MTTVWQDLAACRGEPVRFFFPEGPYAALLAAQGKAICATCPVIAQCRKAGESEGYGVWAGELKDGSRRITRHPKVIPCGTTRGYSNHVRHGEEPCIFCLLAQNEADVRRQEGWRQLRGDAS